MATKTLQIKRKKKIVLAPKTVSAVHHESEEISVPDDAFISQSVEDAVAAHKSPSTVLPQGLQTRHFFDAYLAESQKLKGNASGQQALSEKQAPAKSSSSKKGLGTPSFKFFCYRCGQKLQVPVSWSNQMHTCAACGHEILIPPPLIGDVQ